MAHFYGFRSQETFCNDSEILTDKMMMLFQCERTCRERRRQALD